MKDIFHFAEMPFNQKNDSTLKRRCDRLYLGRKIIFSLGPKLWDLVPNAIKNAASLEYFIKEIKLWTTDKCPCSFCEIYINISKKNFVCVF